MRMARLPEPLLKEQEYAISHATFFLLLDRIKSDALLHY